MGLIEKPTILNAAGEPPKKIAEYLGCLNTGTAALSVARMASPAGWQEPGQTPEFDEFTLVLRGAVRIETREGVTRVAAGQAFLAPKGEWVRYSTPEGGGADYIAVCLPAFSSAAVHRDIVASATNRQPLVPASSCWGLPPRRALAFPLCF